MVSMLVVNVEQGLSIVTWVSSDYSHEFIIVFSEQHRVSVAKCIRVASVDELEFKADSSTLRCGSLYLSILAGISSD